MYIYIHYIYYIYIYIYINLYIFIHIYILYALRWCKKNEETVKLMPWPPIYLMLM